MSESALVTYIQEGARYRLIESGLWITQIIFYRATWAVFVIGDAGAVDSSTVVLNCSNNTPSTKLGKRSIDYIGRNKIAYQVKKRVDWGELTNWSGTCDVAVS